MSDAETPRKIARTLTGLALIIALFGCSKPQPTQSAPKPVRIGAVLPLTGESADWGKQGRWGIEAAVRDVNAGGGVGGRPLEVIFEDSQALPRRAVPAFSKLASVDHVPAVVGDIVSASTLAMAPLAEEQKIVLVAPTSSAPAITSAGRFIYRVWPSDNLEGTVFGAWASANGYRKVAIVHIATDYGVGLADAFERELSKNGGQVTSRTSYAQNETEFKPYLTKAASSKPDAIYLISYYKDAALALRQAREIGIRQQFFGATAVESPELLKLAGAAAEGLIYPTIVDFDIQNPSSAQRKFIDRFHAAHGSDPDWASSHAYDAVIVIADAMRKGGTTGDEIRQEIDRRKVFSGVTGKIVFDANGDVVDKPVAMKTVRNGKFEALDTKQVAQQ